MILRRIGSAIKKQDWFVVLIEIFVVVVGIYLGLQVDDWYKARQDRADEKVFMFRLHEDILNAEELASRVLERRLERWDSMLSVTDILFGRTDRETLTGEECATMVSLHYFNVVVSELSTVTELTATGRMAIIQDVELRTALAKLDQTRAGVNNLINIQQSVTADLPSKYPELISRDAFFNTEAGEIKAHHFCDLAAMRENRRFLNDFSANADAYDGFIQDGLRPWANQFARVHQLVDEVLGLNHQGEN
ncbi:MAG: hypothetical protein IH901_06320 [Proteobacteria bacterium]|nr:hypothetical protein [Pseudomonadota bacterium]